ncbi:hypothetical protein SAMN05444161_8402 [Rhizobiales bacterium GAS191]|nr:hypothetical protein SAMN05444161_8402 [Rhizobiales bacterium GAS191]
MRNAYKPTMTRLLIAMTTAALLQSGPSLAQVGTAVLPAIGMTSPLGSSSSFAPAGPVGIPMGAVELNPGGLSPMPLSSTGSAVCSGVGMSSSGMAGSVGMSSSGSSGSSSTYDGGGMSGAMSGYAITTPSTLSGTCGSTASGSSSSGTSATPSIAGLSSGRAGIPLGSTEVGNLGISPILVVPGPISTLSPPTSPGIPTLTLPASPPSSASTGTSGLGVSCVGGAGGGTLRSGTMGSLSLSGC